MGRTLRTIWMATAALMLVLLTVLGVQSSFAQTTAGFAPWSSIEYKWPTASGRSMTLSGSPYRQTAWHDTYGSVSALDLFYESADTRMLAMAAGEIVKVARCNVSFNVEVRDVNNVTIGYNHLDTASLDSSTIYEGAQIAQGQVLGEARKGDFEDGCGSAEQQPYNAHVHLALPIDPAHRPFVIETCAITYPDKFFVCDGQQLGPGSRMPPSTNNPGVDTTPPTVSLAVSSPANAQGWYASPPTITAAASDDVEVTSTTLEIYRDGALIETRTGEAALAPFSFTSDGRYQLVLRASDAANNTATAELSINLDQTAPMPTFTGGSDGRVLIGGEDGPAGSGVAGAECSADGLAWSLCEALPRLTPSLYVRVCDLAGNCAQTSAQMQGWQHDHWWVNAKPNEQVTVRMLPASDSAFVKVCRTTPKVRVGAGESYTVAATILSADGSMRPVLRLVWLDRQNQPVAASLIEREPGFTGVLSELVVAPPRAVAVRPELQGDGAGQLWIDDVSLRDTNGAELMPNGSFDQPEYGKWRICGRIAKTAFMMVAPRPDGTSMALHLSARPVWAADQALMVENGDAQRTTHIQSRQSSEFAVTPGQAYRLLLPLRLRNVSRGVRMELNFLNAQGERIGSVQSEAANGSIDWSWNALEGIAPEGAVTAQVRIVLKGWGSIQAETATLIQQ